MYSLLQAASEILSRGRDREINAFVQRRSVSFLMCSFSLLSYVYMCTDSWTLTLNQLHYYLFVSTFLIFFRAPGLMRFWSPIIYVVITVC